MSDELYNNLKPLLGPSEEAIILIRPDPDSLSSACALRELFKKNHSGAEIVTYEPIKRLDNRTMVKTLRIPLTPLKEVKLKDFTRFCIVDGQPNQFPDVSVDEWHIIIDHHPPVSGYDAAFKDIRPELGATATIMAEYLFNAEFKIGQKLATSLCYGIITDTDRFQRNMTQDDALAFSSLFPHISYHLLKVIEQTEIPMRQLRFIDTAIHRLHVKSRRAVVHIGAPESADIAVIIADFLLGVSGIEFVAVSCVVPEKLIIIFRSRSTRRDAGKIARLHFSKFGSAGGHSTAARAELPLSELPREVKIYSPESIEDFIKKRLSRPGKKSADQ